MAEREDQRVAITTITLGQVRIEHETAMLNHVYPIGRRFERVMIIGQSILDARNLAMWMAEQSDWSFVFFWDDDIVPQSPAAFGLIMAGFDALPQADVIGGVYPRRGVLTDPIVVKDPGAGVWWGWRHVACEDHKDHQSDCEECRKAALYAMHKVYMTGTGFMGVRMSSMKKLDLPTYTVGDRGQNVHGVRRYFDNTISARSDDFHFADLCLLNDLNWYVAGGAICDQIELDGTVYRIQDAIPKVVEEKTKKRVKAVS